MEIKLLIQATIVTGLAAGAQMFEYGITYGWTVHYPQNDIRWQIMYLLWDLSCGLNPIVYAIFNKKLRRLLMETFGIRRSEQYQQNGISYGIS